MQKIISKFANKNISLNCINICVYISIMILGMAVSGYVTIVDRPSTFWIINLIGFIIYFIAHMFINKSKNYKFMYVGLAYIIISSITLLLHSGHVFDNTKSFGLNVNIFVVGINIFLVLDSLKNVKLTKEDINLICVLILGIGVLSFIYNLIYGGFSLDKIKENLNDIYKANTSSFFDNKNSFGIFTYFSIVAGLYLLINCKHKALTCICLAAEVFTLIITFCRDALLATGVFGIALIILLIVERKVLINDKTRKIIIFIASLLAVSGICVIIGMIANEEFKNFIMGAVLRVDRGNTGRTEIWKEAISKFNKTSINFILGIGYSELNAGGNSYLHNSYLEIFVTGGIVKCLFYIFIIYIGIKNLFFSKERNLIKAFSKAVFVSYFAFAYYESQIIFELGITPFLFMLFMYILPNTIEGKNEFVKLENIENFE